MTYGDRYGQPSTTTLDVCAWLVIGHEIELYAMLQIRFAARQGETETTHRVNRHCDLFVAAATEAGRGNRHECCVVVLWREYPFDGTWPFDQNSPIVLD